jgi:hypothetical protein
VGEHEEVEGNLLVCSVGAGIAGGGLPAGAVRQRCGGGSPLAVRRGSGGVGMSAGFRGPWETDSGA